jgi:hypothetical protein
MSGDTITFHTDHPFAAGDVLAVDGSRFVVRDATSTTLSIVPYWLGLGRLRVWAGNLWRRVWS